MKMPSFCDIPVEVQEQIFLNLSPRDLRNCCLVSTKWYDIINSNRVWQRICEVEGFANKRFLDSSQMCIVNPLKQYSSQTFLAPSCYWKEHFNRYKYLKTNWKTGKCVTVPNDIEPCYMSEYFLVVATEDTLVVNEVYGALNKFTIPLAFPDSKAENFISNEQFIAYVQEKHLICLRKNENSFEEIFQVKLPNERCPHYKRCTSTIQNLKTFMSNKFILIFDPSVPCSLFLYSLCGSIKQKRANLHKAVRKNKRFSVNKCEVIDDIVFLSYDISWETYIIRYGLESGTWGSPLAIETKVSALYLSNRFTCVKMFSEDDDNPVLALDYLVPSSPIEVCSFYASQESSVAITSEGLAIFFINFSVVVRGLLNNYIKVIPMSSRVIQFSPVWNQYLVILDCNGVSLWDWERESKLTTPFRMKFLDFSISEFNLRVSETNVLLEFGSHVFIVSFW